MQFAGQPAYGRSVTVKEKTLRAQMFDLLRPNDPMSGARRWRKAHLVILGIGLLAVILLSIDEMPASQRVFLRGAI